VSTSTTKGKETMDPKLLSDEEVGAQIGMSAQTVQSRRSLQRGKLRVGEEVDYVPRWVDMPGRKIPRTLGTPQAEIDAWLERNLIPTTRKG
jgi:hypothetical protein